METTTLRNKTALVTGASRGIGRATAAVLAEAGAHVLVHYGRSSREAESLVDSIRAQGGRAEAIQADLATTDGATALAKEVRAIGGDRLDVLVCNAGVTKSATIRDHTIEDFDNLFATNVRSPFFLIQQVLPILGQGSNIVLISLLSWLEPWWAPPISRIARSLRTPRPRAPSRLSSRTSRRFSDLAAFVSMRWRPE